MDRLRPVWLASTNDRVGDEFAPDVGACIASGVGEEGADTAASVGSVALRSPVRTRSVAGGSAAFPAESARRRARAA
jgi:hypothetical protein